MSAGDAQRRVCVLTGAGGRLGSAFCRAYAAEYDIVAVYRSRRPDAVSQFESYVDPLAPEAELEQNRNPVHLVRADLAVDADLERIVELTLARYGRVDLLVNGAAHLGIHPHGLLDGSASLDDAARQFRVNVEAPLRLAVRFAQSYWRDRDLENRRLNRNVVNVSSLSASRVYPHAGQAVYAASKAALNQLTRHLAAEFASIGVRVNGLAPNSFPGLVDTAAVAKAIVELDRSEATGRILAVDAPEPESDGSS